MNTTTIGLDIAKTYFQAHKRGASMYGHMGKIIPRT